MINLIIESSPLFNEPNLHKLLLKSRCDWLEPQYVKTKLKLESLFKRELTKEEFHLIIETWCHYTSFVKYITSKDNYFIEQLEELTDSLSSEIKLLEKKIDAQQNTIQSIQSMEQFIYIDMEQLKTFLSEDIKQLTYLKTLKEILKLGPGKGLCLHGIQEKAQFVLFFIGELLGLAEPKIRKEGNPLLTFLLILQDWSTFEEHATRKRLSNIYGKYKKFKNQTKNAELITKLHQMAGKKASLYLILEQFKSHVLHLVFKPRIYSITQSTQ